MLHYHLIILYYYDSIFEKRELYKSIFKTDGWMRNFEDVMYFLEKLELIKLQHKNDIISHISVLSKNKRHLNSMNQFIHYEWTRGLRHISGEEW